MTERFNKTEAVTRMCSVKKVFLKNFVKFTGTVPESLFLTKWQTPDSCTSILL